MIKNQLTNSEIDDKLLFMKKELNFKTNIEDLDKIFFIKDYLLKEGYISEKVSRQVCYRIVETFMSWNEYLHSLIMPNPQNMLNLSESKVLSQEDKKEIIEIMKKGMEICSRNSVIGLEKDKNKEAVFIDDAIKTWNEEFKPKLIRIMVKINQEWKK